MNTSMPPDAPFEPYQGEGFVLERPAGWAVGRDARGLVTVEGDGLRLAVWPVLAGGTAGPQLAAFLRAMAGEVREGVAWGEPAPLGERVWAVEGDGPEAGFARLALGGPVPHGQPAWLFVATAPDRARLEALRPTAERVFRSYRPGGARAEGGAARPAPQAAEGPGSLRTTRFVEPTEGAFAVEVPAEGWQAQGGLVRQGTAANLWYRLLAADGRAEVRFSDPRLPLGYVDPHPMYQMQGQGPGAMVNGNMIRPYVPPAAFAEEYAGQVAREHRGAGIEVTRRIGMQEVLAEMPPAARQRLEAQVQRDEEKRRRFMPQMQTEVQLGGVAFRGTGGTPLEGQVVVHGLRYQMPDMMGGVMSGWGATPVGFVAPPERRAEVEAVARHLDATMQRNPQWEARQDQLMAQRFQQHQQFMHQTQQQMAQENAWTQAQITRIQGETSRITQQAFADRSRIAAQTSAEISAMQNEGYWSRQQSMDEMQRRNVNSIYGTADVYNPATGDVIRGLPDGTDHHYWVDHQGNTVITPYDQNPDPYRFERGQNLDDLYDGGPR
jgi:hypothetical protein